MTDALTRTGRMEREAMRRGSEQLRDRIFALLAERDGRFAALVQHHSAARRAIARGVDPETVKSLFDLSDTAYDDLAGHVSEGFVA